MLSITACTQVVLTRSVPAVPWRRQLQGARDKVLGSVYIRRPAASLTLTLALLAFTFTQRAASAIYETFLIVPFMINCQCVYIG